jgi:hypothetical protein
MLLMEQHCRDGCTHSEGNSKVDLLEISHWGSEELNYLLYSPNRRYWSFAFTHASTSSKCILSAIRYLSQIDLSVEVLVPWDVDWIVSGIVDWLKVRDFALIKEIS